ncbi:MAG: PKD domain-containing protein, partial [Verrucomicrobia bacterium]|nr:PKD domain-containing protein [Verrucomicrobiota bacterium]
MLAVWLFAAGMLLATAGSALADVRYVNVNSATPMPPYTTWATAATTIQDAVDAAVASDQILVTNGVYQTGGQVASEAGATTTNRVAVTKVITVQSVNGAGVTLIQGGQVMRCVYLTNGAALVGFTLTNGVGYEAGGGGVWCGSGSAVASDCVLTSNSAYVGGGASGCTLDNCTLTGNSAYAAGGGATLCTLNNCTLSGNLAVSVDGVGGGASLSTLNNCILTSNSASVGGGASGCTLNNCTLTGNSARVGAWRIGGGAWDCTLNNCIAYYNSAPSEDNYLGSILNYSCTTPLPASGIGNLTNAPLFLDQAGGNLRLQSNSPCINAGSNAAAPAGPDLDGNPRIAGGKVDMGAYEFQLLPLNISTIRYVNVNSANPTPPYTNWATAATAIQDAVDAAVAGDQILVTNGVYQTGQRTVSGATNRVAVTKPVTLQSVNGPAATLIQGDQITRCVYLTNGAALMGFTLIGGAAIYGGGVWCESASAILSNCTITANSARQGGGAHGGTLFNCMLNSNSASGGGSPIGGGAHGCILNSCSLSRNSAAWLGGGASESALNNCTLSGNSAALGGGTFDSTLNNCRLTGNSATSEGGGAVVCMLNNCTLTGNSANEGGGAYNSELNNCIVYYNSAPNGDNSYSSRLSYSCTTPLPFYGVGNISAEPQLADLSHLSAGSPCRGAGSAAAATGLDIDGEPWANPPSIGCDEYHSGVVNGPLSVSIRAAYTNVIPGLAINFTAALDGHATANRWDFGDGMVVSNRLYASHSWAVAGEYLAVFKAYNDVNPGGITATVTVHVVPQPVHYVAVSSANPVSPYSSWATAANNIQDAVDAASVAGALVLVTNGVYKTGGRVGSEAEASTNRVAVTKALMVRSINGAVVTVIQGYRDPNSNFGEGGVRCVYLANGAALVGFTLTNGAAEYGGGVWCESASATVSNCVLSGNLAYLGGGATGGTLHNCRLSGNSSTYGGAASGGTLDNCALTANSALDGGGASSCTLNNCELSGNKSSFGGGAVGSTLINCTFSGNLATNGGGGASGCWLTNCIVYNNSAPNGDNYSDESFLSYSCTTPLPTNGIGNLTNAPLFLDQAGGNLRLQSNSPCINAGSNASTPAGPDLDGNPRMAGGTVDIGAYEFQTPQSLISYAWLQQYNLPIDGSADNTDTDG